MKFFDKVLRYWRISKVNPYIHKDVQLLDIGCYDELLIKKFEGKIHSAVGIDPLLTADVHTAKYTLLKGYFPDVLEAGKKFHVITMLAVLEHIDENYYDKVSQGCFHHLHPGGHLVITVPDALVDKVLDILIKIGILDGMSTDEHHGYDINNTRTLFEKSGLKLIKHKRFQLGLNNVFVFQKPI
ncbi:MAG: methyltransferase domain-containing protein [Cytophagales bacterium]|nr:methyltransferase domain-containing protein [Cytophagales bacterium]